MSTDREKALADRANLRSETPMGFARAVYEANVEHNKWSIDHTGGMG